MASELTYRDRLEMASWSFIQVLESDSEQDREELGEIVCEVYQVERGDLGVAAFDRAVDEGKYYLLLQGGIK